MGEQPTLAGSLGWGVLIWAALFALSVPFHDTQPHLREFIEDVYFPFSIGFALVAGVGIQGARYLSWKRKCVAASAATNLSNLVHAARSELLKLEKDTEMLLKRLGVSFSAEDFMQHGEKFNRLREMHGISLLKDPEPLKTLISRLLQKAQEDLGELRRFAALYENAIYEYRRTRQVVHESYSQSLLGRLDEAHKKLFYGKLGELIRGRQWSACEKLIKAAIVDFQELRNVASTTTKGDRPRTETDEEKAYRILGVPPTVSDQQIRKLYKKLATVYHPDASAISDDERFKEINWAYRVLKAARQMT